MRGSVSLVNLPGIVLCVSGLPMIGSRALLPRCRHMTSTVHGTDDLLVGHLAFVRDYVLLARMARILRLLYLNGLSAGSLLRLALRVSLRRGLPNGPLGTDLTLLRRGLPRLPKLLGLLHLLWLPRRSLLFARHVAPAVVLARLPSSLLLRIALGPRPDLLASEPSLYALLRLFLLAAIASFSPLLLLLLTAKALLRRLLTRHLATTLHLRFPALGGFPAHASLLGGLEFHLLAQRQLARGLLPLDLAPVLLTAKATLNPHVGVLPPVRTGVLM